MGRRVSKKATQLQSQFQQACAQAQQEQQLVSVWREQIDSHQIQGFVLGNSPAFLCLEYVKDFVRDGLMVLRTQDISRCETTSTDCFQSNKTERFLATTPDPGIAYAKLMDWRQVIAAVMGPERMLIIEDEASDVLYLGQVLVLGAECLSMRQVNGPGRWMDEATEIDYSWITCLQQGNGYINKYAQALKKPPGR